MDGTAAALAAGLLVFVLAGGVVDFGLLLHAAMTRHAATGSAAIAVFLALLAPLRGAGIIKPPRVFVGAFRSTLEGFELTWP
jgi:hypothetical protein